MSGDGVMVRLAGLVHRYGDLTAVAGIDLEIRQGETFGLIGPDGAGKTTTLKVVMGLLVPSRGSVETCGFDPGRARQRRRLSQHLGYLAQRFSLYGDLSVDENIAFFAAVHGVRGWRDRRETLLEMLRMTPFRRRLAERLSGGMKQKLALACTLIHTPKLLVLDEPTTGVDPVSRRDFWKTLARLQREGLTLLLTTPYLDEAERCTRVAMMDHGRFLSCAVPSALRADWPGAMFEVLASPKRDVQRWLNDRAGVASVEMFGERLHAALPDIAVADRAAAAASLEAGLRDAGFEVRAVRPIRPSLEDVFISRIRASAGEAGATSESAP